MKRKPTSLSNRRVGGCVALRLHLFAQMLRQIGTLRDRSILDVGCGEGDLSRIMALRGARVMCLDKRKVLPAAIGRSGKKLWMEFIRADIAQFKSKSKFDVVTAFFTLNEI